MDGFHIYDPIRDDLKLVEEHLRAICQSAAPGAQELLSHALQGGGKRIRPAVTLLASKLHPCPDPSLPIIMAAGVEMLHLATLIHDDTVDHSDRRRGKATVSHQWGKEAALLLGDYVFAISATLVAKTGNLCLIERYTKTLMDIAQGELTEHLGSFNWRLTREEYFQRISRKTAALFSSAAEAGALLSDAPEPLVEALASYGTSLGMAFQVVDDILDFLGSEEEMGKPVGEDLAQGTLTLPAVLFLERYPQDNPLVKAFQGADAPENLDRAFQMIRSDSILEDCYAIAWEFSRAAEQALGSLERSVYRQSLLDLARYAVARQR